MCLIPDDMKWSFSKLQRAEGVVSYVPEVFKTVQRYRQEARLGWVRPFHWIGIGLSLCGKFFCARR